MRPLNYLYHRLVFNTKRAKLLLFIGSMVTSALSGPFSAVLLALITHRHRTKTLIAMQANGYCFHLFHAIMQIGQLV